MKLEILQDNLSKAISSATRFASSRAQLPVLGNILLKANKNKLEISATNLEMGINISIGAKVEENGEITVPAKLINEIVQNLNRGSVNLSVDKEKLEIKAEKFQSTVAGMNASDFPDVPKVFPKNSLSLAKEKLQEALSKVLYSVSIDETRPTLTGVLFTSDGKTTYLVSTDGFRLSRLKLDVVSKKNMSVIIPKNALSELSSVIENSDEVLFAFDEKNNQVLFKSDSYILSSRVIQGTFPDYEKIIPKNTQIEANLDTVEFTKGVKLASVFARDSSNVVKMIIQKNSVDLSAESQYSGNQKTSIDAKIDGGVLDIAFNFRFLLDFAQSVKDEGISMKFVDANSPGVFLNPKDKNYLHLIMPVKLSS